MPKVTFKIEGGKEVIFFAAPKESILEAARKANVAIDAPCSGNASCGKCRVKLLKGNLDSAVSRHISEDEYNEGYRLACLSHVIEDVEILVPDIESAYKSRMKIADLSSNEEVSNFTKYKEEMEQAGIKFENGWEEITCRMDPPSLDSTMPDNERFIRQLKKDLGMSNIVVPYSVIKKLPDTLRDNNFTVKCIINKCKDKVTIFNILPENKEAVIAGLAVDIGTTTVSAMLVNMENGDIIAKASTGNAQIRYGADVINRIIESCKPGGGHSLQTAIVKETINPLINEMCEVAHISHEDIVKMCIASNTTMNHLFLGLNSDNIRKEPYIPTFYEIRDIKASDTGVEIYPDAEIIFTPNVGSYVGGDITAGALACMIWNKEELTLFIDLGTNGEIVFGNKDFLMTCACSAGPAFEGGDISCGMRATYGAVEACTINENTMEPTLTIIGDKDEKPVGVCGSGIIDLVDELYRCKIIDSRGVFIAEGKRIIRDEMGIGSYIIAFKEDAGSVKDITISEVDIDNFIRAKGAIFSAIKTMIESIDMDVSMIESIYVAGGIGSGINMEKAINIGMFPKLPIDKFHYIGNSSLTGAYAALLSDSAFKKVKKIARNMTYMELSVISGYMDQFMAACFIPHTDASLFI